MASSSIGFTGAPTLTNASSSATTPSTVGLSDYSQDLQNEVNSEVAQAELPMQELQSEVTDLQNQTSELGTLSTDFQSLQSSVSALNSASQGILSASVSNQNVLSASVSAGALAGTFTVTVTSPGSYSTALSSVAVSDPTSQGLDSASSYTLTANGVSTTITPAGNTLDDLVAAINANTSDGVQATVVNVGSATSPEYELDLQSTSLGTDPISLTDTGGSTNLVTGTAGSYAAYSVDNSSSIQASSSTVTLSPGVTVNLLGDGTSTVTVAPSSTTLTNALSNFVTAYNQAVTDLGKNFGQNGGALAGDNIIYTLQQALNSLGNYTTTANGVTGLSALGITFDPSNNGQLDFDPTVLEGDNSTQLSAAASFLGNASSSGFLQFATNTLTNIADPTSGLIANETTQDNNTINSDNQLITQEQAQITQLQSNLQSQMSTADAAIASLESQQTFYSSLFTSMLIPSPEELATL